VYGVDSLEIAVHWACHAWQTLYLSLSFVHKPEITAEPFSDFVHLYAIEYLNETAEKHLKYHLTYIYAKQREQALPLRPTTLAEGQLDGILGGGWLYRLCKRTMASRELKFSRIAHNLKMAKLGMPVVSIRFRERAQSDYLSKMGNTAEKPRFSKLVPEGVGGVRAGGGQPDQG